MKEATGEVSGTVITIVLVGAVLAIGLFLFGGEDSIGRQWIVNFFGSQITNQEQNYD